jgi:uncharacterized membrane protein YdbT with pleckstrin-like domain
MSYVKSVLQPNEHVIAMGRLHWIIYWRAILCLVLGTALLVLEQIYGVDQTVKLISAALVFVLIMIFFLHPWFICWTTEIAVTNKRLIYKRGFINRHTVEMNLDKVESVDVNQSVLGRMLDYGTLVVQGTGHGDETLDDHQIAAPLEFRSAITTHEAVAPPQKAS